MGDAGIAASGGEPRWIAAARRRRDGSSWRMRSMHPRR